MGRRRERVGFKSSGIRVACADGLDQREVGRVAHRRADSNHLMKGFSVGQQPQSRAMRSVESTNGQKCALVQCIIHGFYKASFSRYN